MTQLAIKAENISKLYRLGELGTGTLSQDLERWYLRLRGKEDRFSKIGEQNDRTKKANSDFVWSLKDIDFEVNQGEAVGIVGRNGAGKSTLLKLLSRVTSPTTGSITGQGRIASLLEVGTGFHPELTGRENIFLNGAILGMRKREIRRKFDEIVDFAGVERYIDTPVKRYSSGMYVRLAFAVAAHLESEILIVDEVLAVGDAEFQKKCLGKMGSVSRGEGRTVLFVSHNMAAVKNLCSSGILLQNGRIQHKGSIDEIISSYISHNEAVQSNKLDAVRRVPGHGLEARFDSVQIINTAGEVNKELMFGEPFSIQMTTRSVEANSKNLNFGIRIENESEVYITSCLSGDINAYFNVHGELKLEVNFKDLRLVPGRYFLTLSIRRGNVFVDQVERALSFSVSSLTYEDTLPHNNAWGIVQYYPNWSEIK